LEKPQIAGIEHLGVLIAKERKDRLALVPLGGLGKSSEHALALIDKIVKEAACP
jgi:hypothetical protein